MTFRLILFWLTVLTYVIPLSLSGEPLMGLVNVSVACMRAEPRHGAELVSQAIMGTPLQLIEHVDSDWWLVQSPDGYEAYMIDNSLVVCNDDRYEDWKSAPRVVVTSGPQTVITEVSGHGIVSDAVNGCILEGVVTHGDSLCLVTLPDGRIGTIHVCEVTPIEQWADQPYNPETILTMGLSIIGTPYLWGGMSAKSLDCSGFVRVCFWANGRILPRDASPQSQSGEEVTVDQLCRGDLLFFGNSTTGRINHVAISVGGLDFLHCSGRVMRGSLDTSSPDYSPLYFVKAVHPGHGYYGSMSVVPVISHPWYFSRVLDK